MPLPVAALVIVNPRHSDIVAMQVGTQCQSIVPFERVHRGLPVQSVDGLAPGFFAFLGVPFAVSVFKHLSSSVEAAHLLADVRNNHLWIRAEFVLQFEELFLIRVGEVGF